jgi:hypothetical protein
LLSVELISQWLIRENLDMKESATFLNDDNQDLIQWLRVNGSEIVSLEIENFGT